VVGEGGTLVRQRTRLMWYGMVGVGEEFVEEEEEEEEEVGAFEGGWDWARARASLASLRSFSCCSIRCLAIFTNAFNFLLVSMSCSGNGGCGCGVEGLVFECIYTIYYILYTI